MTNMKDTIRNALVSKLQSSSLDSSITVTDIATDCGISRQAFYYYFNDIYDVVESIFLEQTERALNEYSDIDSWQIGYIIIIRSPRHQLPAEAPEAFLFTVRSKKGGKPCHKPPKGHWPCR